MRQATSHERWVGCPHGRESRALDVRLLLVEDEPRMAAAVAMACVVPETKILMLTAAASPTDLVAGLALGVDDYLAKPFRFAELVARVHALARRAGSSRPAILRAADIELDPARRTATRTGRELGLSLKEFGVLETLMAADGAVVSPEELLARVWDENVDPFTNTIRMTVMKLRRKLGEPSVVHTVQGAGYRI